MGRELPQGRRVGNYAVERLLSKAGLSASYAARQSRTERPCILTVFHLDPDEEPWTRFKRECEQLGALKHPSIVETLDVGIAHDGTPYLVTEALPGETLASRLRRRGALTLSQTLGVVRQAGAALYAGHGIGILHRDIRPDNLHVLGPEGEASADAGEEPLFERIKLTGFGIGRLMESTLGGMGLVGNADYLAPEQILGHALDIDPRVDQYALAVVLYQALTTSRPFHGDSVGATLMQVTRAGAEPLRALRPDVPQHIEQAITRAMSRDRDARFPDINAFLQVVQEGVPLPMGMAELTEPWLSAPLDMAEARRLAAAAGAAPAAPLSIGVSAALALAVKARLEHGDQRDQGGQGGQGDPGETDNQPGEAGPPSATAASAATPVLRAEDDERRAGAAESMAPGTHDAGVTATHGDAPAADGGAATASAHDAEVAARRAEAAAALALLATRADDAVSVPQAVPELPTVPHSMDSVMRLAVPPHSSEAVPSKTEFDPTSRNESPVPPPAMPLLSEGDDGDGDDEDLSSPLEIVAEFTEDGQQVPQAGETEVTIPIVDKPAQVLPSIIVDLPTRPVTDSDRLPRGVAAPNDPTRTSPLVAQAQRDLPDLWQRFLERLETRASLAERIGWALVGAGLGGLIGHFFG